MVAAPSFVEAGAHFFLPRRSFSLAFVVSSIDNTFVFDRNSLKTHFAFKGIPAAAGLSRGDGPRASLETAQPPELERRH